MAVPAPIINTPLGPTATKRHAPHNSGAVVHEGNPTDRPSRRLSVLSGSLTNPACGEQLFSAIRNVLTSPPDPQSRVPGRRLDPRERDDSRASTSWLRSSSAPHGRRLSSSKGRLLPPPHQWWRLLVLVSVSVLLVGVGLWDTFVLALHLLPQ